MRVAVISDIHANQEALEVVLQGVDRLGADRTVSLGDLVGYNASPNECVRTVREREIPTLMGNHDAVACGIEEPVDFNPIARTAALWTRSTLTPEHREFLAGQPEQRRLSETVLLVHGSMLHRDHYLFSREDMMKNIRRMRSSEPGIRVVLFGHTHHQVAVAWNADDNSLSAVPGPRITLTEGLLYLINPGSVGQPRDHDPRSAFLMIDEDRQSVEFIRLPYDVRACAERILAAGLPTELADRLYQGW